MIIILEAQARLIFIAKASAIIEKHEHIKSTNDFKCLLIPQAPDRNAGRLIVAPVD
jgi:hypothetical protein